MSDVWLMQVKRMNKSPSPLILSRHAIPRRRRRTGVREQEISPAMRNLSHTSSTLSKIHPLTSPNFEQVGAAQRSHTQRVMSSQFLDQLHIVAGPPPTVTALSLTCVKVKTPKSSLPHHPSTRFLRSPCSSSPPSPSINLCPSTGKSCLTNSARPPAPPP
ncbi:uncharacterized protein BKA78DRAFT_70144 [Phyllosticta capitalensis]|uniref:uncharacterized protein n=1 Tax=Phyllosticta capitalensis TaxID=121624 RepID=UPI003131417F